MMTWSSTTCAVLAGAALFLQSAAAQTPELRVLSSNGVKAVMEELIPEYERVSSRRVAVRFNSSTALKAAIDGGETFDVAIVTSDLMDTLVKESDVVADSRAGLATTGIGVGVRKGAPKPDIGTPDAMKRTLLNAKAITYAQDGASRVHIENMLNRLGISAVMQPKIILEQGSIRSTARVAQGDAELVITLVSEILPIQGIELVGPLPDAFQSYVSFSAGIATKARDSEAAKALIGFLSGAGARPTFKAKGLDPAQGSPRAEAPKGLRLYVLDCGVLNVTTEGVERYHVTPAEVGETRMSVPCFLVAHPRGTLMWDVGVIPDADVEREVGGAHASVNPVVAAVVTRTLASQLASIGYRSSDVTYVAVSHAHIDHTANLNQLAGSTWLTRSAERDFMWADGNTRVRPAFYAALKTSKTTLIDRDEYDVFGDGQVVIKSAPGHTPGHQVLILNLAATGLLMLSGDLYHYPQERTLHRAPPENEFNVQQSAASRATIEEYLRRTGTTLWIEHDFTANSRLKKAPAYYE